MLITTYLTPYDLFGGKIPKDTLYYSNIIDDSYYSPVKNIIDSRWSLPKEIVEKWERVILVDKDNLLPVKIYKGIYEVTKIKLE